MHLFQTFTVPMVAERIERFKMEHASDTISGFFGGGNILRTYIEVDITFAIDFDDVEKPFLVIGRHPVTREPVATNYALDEFVQIELSDMLTAEDAYREIITDLDNYGKVPTSSWEEHLADRISEWGNKLYERVLVALKKRQVR